MYYGYERLWDSVGWGRREPGGSQPRLLSWRASFAWGVLTLAAVILITVLVLCVTPVVKP
jgi:hypothetical protein